MLLTEVHVGKYLLTESKNRPGVFEVTGIMQRANAKNHNGRIYKKNLLEREVNNYLDNFVKRGHAYGVLDHPESPIVSLKNASHIVRDLWWDGDDLMGRVELLNTPSGNIVKAILEAGHAIGTSSRGTGSVQQTNEGYLEVQNDFELVCWDFVSNPSTHGAFLRPAQALQESALPGQNKFGRLDQIIRDIICATTCECSL